jgi:hypothetical protein
MEKQIENRVAKSGIINFDLSDLVDSSNFVGLDIKDQLFHGLILKEKDFRNYIKTEDWEKFNKKHVAVYCSADAVIPTWAYMLIANKLHGIASSFLFGSVDELISQTYRGAIESIDTTDYKDRLVVIKGCGDDSVPVSAYMDITNKLKSSVKSLMFGEPCSTVPIYKRKA